MCRRCTSLSVFGVDCRGGRRLAWRALPAVRSSSAAPSPPPATPAPSMLHLEKTQKAHRRRLDAARASSLVPRERRRRPTGRPRAELPLLLRSHSGPSLPERFLPFWPDAGRSGGAAAPGSRVVDRTAPPPAASKNKHLLPGTGGASLPQN